MTAIMCMIGVGSGSRLMTIEENMTTTEPMIVIRPRIVYLIRDKVDKNKESTEYGHCDLSALCFRRVGSNSE